ncbi:SRPBCC family protein [Amycolatopsis nigrescens]|uniref:SRPBCC family protein n=1 Tax=Amycolatopsis nigrescens TaxID=381445 RepID=UPI00035DDE22|nr:SRPBCC domain-containing protein [Amycolatopsis nigrescens]
MPREFEISKEVELAGTPEQVWDAIATGPGIDSWFMGPHEVDPREGGRITMKLGDFSEASTITTWEPGTRLAYRTEPGEDGSFHAMEYLIQGRDGGSTVLRFVHSGVLSDDWGAEFEDMTSYGWDKYLHTLDQYLRYFTGLPGTFVYAEAPSAAEGTDPWAVLIAGLGLTGPFANGDRVRLAPAGLPPIEGVVDYAVPGYRELLGVRGSEGLYRFQGGGPQLYLGHHVFGDVDREVETKAWRDWLERLFAS